MNKIFSITAGLFLSFGFGLAQNNLIVQNTLKPIVAETGHREAEEVAFVDGAFHSPVLINSQTAEVLHKNTFEFLFEQRFGKINSSHSELYGFYTAPNIRTGLAYGFTDKFTMSLGLITFHTLADIGYKYTLLRQTTSNRIPVTLSFYGNTTVGLGHSETGSNMSDRLSFFNQVIASRKINQAFSFFIAPGFMHFNEIDTSKCSIHDSFLFAAGGKLNLSPKTSFILELGQGHLLTNYNFHKARPGVSFGLEKASHTLSFQIFATTFREISEQDNYMYNTNDYLKGDFLIGFNIAVSWEAAKGGHK